MHQIKQESLRMKEALLRGDFKLLHDVLRSSWEAKKRMASQIVNDQIELLYAKALEAGAYCARISGAGGGGFMIFLADPMRKDPSPRHCSFAKTAAWFMAAILPTTAPEPGA